MERSHLTLTSPAFIDNGTIPPQYCCDGENKNPPLEIAGIPDGTMSLVVFIDDPDIPQQVKDVQGIETFIHWVVFNIPPTELIWPEGSVPAGAREGKNSSGSLGYTGPCPPPQYEPTEHRYIFKLYALDTVLELPAGALLQEVEEAMQGHVLDSSQLTGKYDRSVHRDSQ